jgi:hypothetical protein
MGRISVEYMSAVELLGQPPGYDPKEDGEQGKSMLEKVEREREAAS